VPETAFKLRRAGDVALVTLDNGADHTRPTVLGRAALESLAALLPELESGNFAALVVTGKPFVFCAGADVDEFPQTTTRELAMAGSRAGHELFLRLRALPYPTVAAINGACLGGGLELALHCSARTISTAVRHFGFPECFLGILPGWGGTQLVPRLVGPATAIRVIVQNAMRQNRLLGGREAFELGLADRLFEPAEFLDESLAFARDLTRDGIERPEPDWSGLDDLVRRGRSQLDDSTHGAAPAPYRALDLIEGAATWSLEEGYAREEDAVGELLPGPQAQASIYSFQLVERRAKRGVGVPEVDPRPVRKVGIAGAGLMASQLATLFLRRLEVPVVLRDLDQGIVDGALDSIREELAGAAARGRLTEHKARFLGEIATGGTTWDGFADCDLVLEAVVEELPVKRTVFGELREVVRPECVLATNTSALSVSAMGADVGLHFFNPVAVLPLVELVRTPGTSDVAVATAHDVARRLGKRAVVVADAPAFVVNRVLTRLSTVVLGSLERGNTVDEVDEAILRLGLPMAPSVLLQMVGPRVANHVLHTLHAAYPERFPLSPTLDNYAEGRDEIVVVERSPRTAEAILDGVLDALADEIGHLLDEGVVEDAKDVDTCLLLGAGWPFWLGGITRHLDETGVSERVNGRPFGVPLTLVDPVL
jgi:3-hydroxyacyl-CoA dehydrogenase/enoyl-CoA hydratase/carnithine racemase